LLQAFSLSSHPVGPPAGGKPVSSAEMERMLEQPGKVGLNWLVRKGMGIEKMKLQKGTASILQDMGGKQRLQEWGFRGDAQDPFEGIVDIFEDGSMFAISVPGHTPGSVAYLVRTTQGPVLLTGDTSHTRWGWEHAVEPGDFTRDNARNLRNLQRLKALVARHPQVVVRLGHQP
jgi:glyoxylase-like metal-dependent hydrolase (beta-lactamase superfamily II)